MPDQIARILITLDDTKPAVWRRVELPLTNSLKTLHLAIQAAMLFENSHLFQFDVGDTRYGIPFDDEWSGTPTRDAGNIRLGKLVERGIAAFSYTYDFGDNWRHTVVIEAVSPADPEKEYPCFVAGERRAPPEDIGGMMGFEDFVEAMTEAGHSERDAVVGWYGGVFDPADISPEEIGIRMGRLAKRRSNGRVAHKKAQGLQ
ncbi:plasmid pRiA4b ORF-3 family protein [Sphingobium sp. WCS2017Hpa-17]|uniref:plasmid pRiA4b ORF-3 family protein n=1 Tax=Sphingobium sp. WCS2017Hpa-17 TaxID=3073638 RepID=UPI002889E0A5|nr:plasmid pRiA4b ORF-3 family protein [Sphingobium sp. WCS2017Hpa-17]